MSLDLDHLNTIYSESGLALLATPGGYRTPDILDPVSEKSMSLTDLDVPLAVAKYVMESYMAQQDAAGTPTPLWEGAIGDLAWDLMFRCLELEERLQAQR